MLAYAADNAMTFAGGTVLGPNIVTQDLAMSYLRPARGVLLRAEAQVVTHRARHALCRCDLWAVGHDGENVLCAAAQGRITQRGREPDAG